MLELDPQRLNAFILARGLLERGESSVDGTPPGAMGAVVLYDMAVETAARATMAAEPPASYPGTGYLAKSEHQRRPDRKSVPAVLDAILASWRNREGANRDIAELTPAVQLHNLRNSVQHDGVVPSREDLERSRLRALDLVRWLARAFFDADLAEISRAVLVRWPAVREHLLKAEEHAASEDFTWGMAYLRIAFEEARDELKRGEPRRSSFWKQEIERAVDRIVDDDYGSRRRSGPGSQLAGLLVRLWERVERLDDRMEALVLGAEASEYEWFVRSAPHPFRAMNAPDWELYDEPPRTREEYVRAFDFVTSAVLRWQRFFPPEGEATVETEGEEAPS